jgi:hypothetical protein
LPTFDTPRALARTSLCNDDVNMTLAAALLLTLFSCNTAQSMQPIDLSITTEGGFTGRGLGSISIKDEQVTTDRCEATLTDAERKRIGKLLHDAHTDRWSETKSHGHPDQVKYVVRSGSATASFHDPEEAPADVRALYDAAWAVRERVIATCR